MRRTHLRGHENILKRLLIHGGAFNLSLVLRKERGAGTPRGLQKRKRPSIGSWRPRHSLCVFFPGLTPRASINR